MSKSSSGGSVRQGPDTWQKAILKKDLSKAVRGMVARGRILLAVECYKTGEASLGRPLELAGIPVVRMMTILTEFGVESRIEQEDYLRGIDHLRKVW